MISLLLMLAAQAQSPTPTEAPMTVERAMRCASATRQVARAAGKLAFADGVRSVYFIMIAAREAPGHEPFFERVKSLTATIGTYPVAANIAADMTASCLKEESRAGGEASGTLPADAAERDEMCAGTIALLDGLAIGYRNSSGDGAPAARWEPVLATFVQRLERSAKSSAGAGNMSMILGQEAQLATRIGSPETVAGMCEAALH
ncbi:hypothetical protein QH494_18225 [Sphingomonas sp. AR_OL41]|uniref:hypothetical protein n=1 Tax=Sphingomonas sp. AR_OL41 TaxID=3042729 RepID=UPI0024816BCC|nr:hypothetical protein [Sphingomonas sp. AR_OL41]MDH7974129.1 hypothetical protein [Sphingomonas sp. AR_OL41]